MPAHAGKGSYDTPFDGKAELIDLTYLHRLSLSGGSGVPINSCGNKPWLRLSDPPSGLEWYRRPSWASAGGHDKGHPKSRPVRIASARMNGSVPTSRRRSRSRPPAG